MPWHPSFATHVPDLDAQHQYFVALLDQLDVACQRDDEAQIGFILEELKRYARYHFANEEILMEAYDYPSEGQRTEHRKLLTRLDEMISDRTISRAKLQLFVYKWLTNHIQLDDMEMAKHILKRRQPFLGSVETVGDDETRLRTTVAAGD